LCVCVFMCASGCALLLLLLLLLLGTGLRPWRPSSLCPGCLLWARIASQP
jgi:hypothetical protein